MPDVEPQVPEHIEVRGAREHNLRGVDVDIPKRGLTVFTGVSGSGKSSLVFDTIAAESQRLINETYTTFLQSFMATPARPDVDELRNLTAAVVVDQEPMGANARSTVGTATDAYAMLRLLYSRIGTPQVGGAGMFSFNEPQGMCLDCEGLGRTAAIDVDALVDRDRTLREGPIDFPNFQPGSWYWRIFAESGYFDLDTPLRDWTDAQWQRFLHGPGAKIEHGGFTLTYEGLLPKIQRLHMVKDIESLQPHVRRAVRRIATFAPCDSCGGTRLNVAARSVTVAGRTIAECAAMQVTDLVDAVDAIDDPAVAPLVRTLRASLGHLVDIGLGYLSLDRESSSLSGGESQRVRMVRHLGSPITDITYVFDEPTVGLHPADVERMNRLLLALRDKGNTVLVVEHAPEVMAIADHVVDLGPGAGVDGGTVVHTGDLTSLRAGGTVTGRHLDAGQDLRTDPRTPTGALRIAHADLHNLRDITVDVPTGVLTVVTGVAGSGKSSLIHGCLPRGDDVVLVDQAAIRGSRRSTPATYTGMLDHVRRAFAKANGVKASLFSANSDGACPACGGLGVIYTDLAFMAGVATPCQACEGRRYTPEVLAHTLRGRDISEVLAMPVTEALDHFTERPVRRILHALDDVGLGYVTLGQPLTTLSGGERQRLKLAIEIRTDAAVLVLDEPTSGLHMADVAALVGLLDRLVDDGRTVIVIEHNLDVIARADWIIDLGPGAGHDGGRVVFEGPPTRLIDAEESLTGRHLRAHVRPVAALTGRAGPDTGP